MSELPKPQVETNQTVAINKVILKRNIDLHKQLEHETETQENLSLQIQHFETKTNVLLNLLDLTVEKQKLLYTRVKSQNTDNNASQKECDQWSERYDKLSKILDNTLEKLEEHKDKLRSLDIRNTNKNIKRRDEKIEEQTIMLSEQKEAIQEIGSELDKVKQGCEKKRKSLIN